MKYYYHEFSDGFKEFYLKVPKGEKGIAYININEEPDGGKDVWFESIKFGITPELCTKITKKEFGAAMFLIKL